MCGKRGHNAADCWDKLDADQAKLDVAKANRDQKKADMAKRKPSSKDSTCHASLHGCVFDQEFVPHTPGTVLDSYAQVNILEGTLGSGTRIQLTGITGATTSAFISAERASVAYAHSGVLPLEALGATLPARDGALSSSAPPDIAASKFNMTPPFWLQRVVSHTRCPDRPLHRK